jgi:mRNA-degrading endonuclease toxin of MazEF toxin-antitoxin module
VALPLTTKVSREDVFPLRVRVPAGVCSLARDSEILVDQILTWDDAAFRDNLGVLPEAICDEVRRALLEFVELG